MSQAPRKILVTGAAGMIGARFVEASVARGDEVISVDQTSHFSERPEHKSVRFGKIVDRDALFDWISSEKPRIDAIVHLGACTDTTELDEDYLRRVNLEYSKKIWEAATRLRIPLAYASSAATYGGGELGYSDDESLISRLKPLNPYGESKRLFDLWALEQERAGKTPPAWSGFKFFNVYGFGERHKGKMASVVLHGRDQILAQGEIRLFESHRAGIAHGHQSRDFISVADVVEVLEFAIAKPIARGIYNLGTGKARTFLDLAKATFAGLGKPERVTFIPTPVELRDRYQYFTQAEMTRLRAAGYSKPFTSLEDGVRAYLSRLSAEKL